MTRWKAAGIHFSLSCVIGVTAFCLLYFVYYPQPYFAPAGADQLVFILLGVDVILGPMLTLAVFKSGKWGMKFDLAVISTVQMAALLYGGYVMWVARPVFIVAAVDRINIVYANSLDPADVAAADLAEYRKLPLFGPVRVDLRLATAGKEQIELMGVADGGKDKEVLPKYYVPWSIEAEQGLIKRSAAMAELEVKSQQIIRQAYPNLPRNTRFLPLIGRTDAYVLVIDPGNFRIEQAILASPWKL